MERITLTSRFWEKVERTDTCWNWKGAHTKNGYGQAWVSGRKMLSHRATYIVFRGPIPAPLCIDHLCRNTYCVNPAHLEVVSIRENTLRGKGPAARHARQTHCSRGHEYTPANLLKKSSSRQCRTCYNAWNRAHRRRTDSAPEIENGATKPAPGGSSDDDHRTPGPDREAHR